MSWPKFFNKHQSDWEQFNLLHCSDNSYCVITVCCSCSLLSNKVERLEAELNQLRSDVVTSSSYKFGGTTTVSQRVNTTQSSTQSAAGDISTTHSVHFK